MNDSEYWSLAHARDGLASEDAIRAAAWNAGGVEDPRVILEVAAPGEIRGRGLGMRVGAAECAFGRCVIAECGRGICHVAFVDEGGEDAALAGVREAWPLAEMIRDDAMAGRLMERMFSPAGGGGDGEPWKLYVRGTEFQLRVWRALLRVPPGELVSYGMLAAAVGSPGAARATGRAVGANEIAFLIPCHRVIRGTGETGGYRWGVMRKRALLAWEAGRSS
jgi:AraC family transcriptional regulator of adaptative response/methylated-DNA-[protein]-cysteine methyltransferase